MCLKLTLKTPEYPPWRCYGVFIVSFKHISHLFIVCFEQINVSREENVRGPNKANEYFKSNVFNIGGRKLNENDRKNIICAKSFFKCEAIVFNIFQF